jgi:hypothetical protein
MFVRKIAIALIAGVLAGVSLAGSAKASIVYDLTLTQTSGSGTLVPNPSILVLTFTDLDVFVSLKGTLNSTAINVPVDDPNGFTFNFSSNVLTSITGNDSNSNPRLSFFFSGGNETYRLAPGNSDNSIFAGTVAISAVPEPSTWAMMILGFLGVGFMAYRRKGVRPQLRLA